MGPQTMDLTSCERWQRTILMFAGFIGLAGSASPCPSDGIQTVRIVLCVMKGMCLSIVGPTLQDLAFKLNTTTADMATIYTARSGGAISGCLVGGIMLERFHRVRVLAASYLFSGVLTALLPWCTSLAILIGVMLLNGICMGIIETASTVWCLDLWRKDSGPFVHALHFTFGLGTFIAPFIAEPFLMPKAITDKRKLAFNETTLTRSHINCLTDINELEMNYYEEISFGIVGLFMTVVAFATITVSLINTADPKRTAEKHGSRERPVSAQWITTTIVIIVVVHFLIYGGIEIAYGQLIASYAVMLPETQRLSKSAASFLTSTFWGAFMAGRGASIFINRYVHNLTITIIDHVLIVTACFSLMLFAYRSQYVLWIASALFGLGLSAVYPAVYNWISDHIHVNNRIGGFFAIGTAAGEMVVPLLVGRFIEGRPQFIMNSAAVSSVLMVALFVTLTLLVARLKPQNQGN